MTSSNRVSFFAEKSPEPRRAPWLRPIYLLLIALGIVMGFGCGHDSRSQSEASSAIGVAQPTSVVSNAVIQRPSSGGTSDAPEPSTPRDAPIALPPDQAEDTLALLDRAMTVALSIEAHAVLVAIRVQHMKANGAIDLSRDDAALFVFGYYFFDKTKPPGADVIKGQIILSTTPFGCEHSTPCLSIRKDSFHGDDPDKPRPKPKCSLKNAWRTAITSGIPPNTVAEANYGFWPGPPQLWDFTVAGHEELRRNIDGATCKLANGGDVMRAMRGAVANSPVPSHQSRGSQGEH